MYVCVYWHVYTLYVYIMFFICMYIYIYVGICMVYIKAIHIPTYIYIHTYIHFYEQLELLSNHRQHKQTSLTQRIQTSDVGS